MLAPHLPDGRSRGKSARWLCVSRTQTHALQTWQSRIPKSQLSAHTCSLFFHELAAKSNAIYNMLPDMISQIAAPTAGITPMQFQNIMTLLFGFIKKASFSFNTDAFSFAYNQEKQCESLVEKLCHRFRTTEDVQQWRHFAFCLSQVSYSDKGIKKLTENFACFDDKVCTPALLTVDLIPSRSLPFLVRCWV